MWDIVVQVTKSRHLRDEFSAPKPQYPHGEITVPQFTHLLNLDQRTHNLIVLVTTEVRDIVFLESWRQNFDFGQVYRESWGRAATGKKIGGSQESNMPLVNAIQPFGTPKASLVIL